MLLDSFYWLSGDSGRWKRSELCKTIDQLVDIHVSQLVVSKILLQISFLSQQPITKLAPVVILGGKYTIRSYHEHIIWKNISI